jgi:hypothetical protein
VANPGLSDAQCEEALAALEAANGNQCRASDALGLPRPTFVNRLRAAQQRKERDAREGKAPGHFNSGTAPGYLMGKVTVQRNASGDVERTWERQSPEAARQQAMLEEAVEAFKGEIPAASPVTAPQPAPDDLCNLYTYTDYHLGMRASAGEGGADWNLDIAERTMRDSFGLMIERAPPAGHAVINIQGDMLHTDGLEPVTPAHKHVLDAAGSYREIVRATIRSIRYLVRVALEKHATVHLIICEGNHDEAGSMILGEFFAMHYEGEPRITVNRSELPFYVHRHGEVMLAFHHGHKVKNEQLPMLFAAQFARDWGETTRRYAHCGHRHHADEKEYSGMTVVQHPTLAARDAYAARGGWIADRACQAITYHKRFGVVGRTIICPEMLAA